MAGITYKDRFGLMPANVTIFNEATTTLPLAIDQYALPLTILEPTVLDARVTQTLNENIAEVVSGNITLYDLTTPACGKE